MNFRVSAGKASSDPEKCVLPAIIYASNKSETNRVRVIAFGWWDWHVSFTFCGKRTRAR